MKKNDISGISLQLLLHATQFHGISDVVKIIGLCLMLLFVNALFQDFSDLFFQNLFLFFIKKFKKNFICAALCAHRIYLRCSCNLRMDGTQTKPATRFIVCDEVIKQHRANKDDVEQYGRKITE